MPLDNPRPFIELKAPQRKHLQDALDAKLTYARLTQAQYDALNPKDENTLYLIVE